MAVAVNFREFTPVDSREDLIRRLENAPVDHAEALLEGYELLQRLHEKGLIDLVNGLLNASDTVINHVVGVVSSPEAVKALRIGLMLTNLLSFVDADEVHDVLSGSGKEAPSLLSIGRQAVSKEGRRGMATAVAALSLFGATLKKQASANSAKGQEHS